MSADRSVTLRLAVAGLSCAGCVRRAEAALAAAPGVRAAAVNLATHAATVTLDDAAALPAVETALADAGYPATRLTARLAVDGLHCASCVGRAEAALTARPGVLAARVNLATGAAEAEYLEGATDPAALAGALTDAGYPARPADAPAPRRARAEAETAALGRDAALAGLLALPVFALEMGAHWVPGAHALIARTIGMEGGWLIQFVLTTLMLAGPGRRFFAVGVPALLRGAPEMNALVALGTGAAWGFSTVALFAPWLLPAGARAVYFEAAAVVCALILLGRWLEARARGRAGAAIERLMDLRPATARVERDGAVVETPVEAVRPGDVLHLRPGERVAVDGVALSGRSHLDESMLTGEPVPALKEAGDRLTGGTVNGTGALRYRAEAVGADTVLARIVAMVEQAQGSKLPVQALVDRVTAVFAPAVMALAALTVALWLAVGPAPALGMALTAGVSVLIIACPCAMGLATPMSIMVGAGRAARLGVLFRRGEALQRLAAVRAVALDKTGTLTEGRPALTTLRTADGWTEDAALALMAAVEAASEHPIAQAVTRAAEGMTLPAARDFEAATGLGARATVDGRAVLVGADRFLRGEGVDLGGLAAEGAAMAARGETPVYMAVDGVAVAAAGVSDPVRPGAAAAVAALKAQGLAVAMVTGDNRVTAQAVADRLGVEHVVAEASPADKVAALRDLRARIGPVAFVGDGVNDAPVLAEADAGIAIGGGADIAVEAADVVLMAGEPGGAATAVALSRATMRNIRQNLFWAFAYNAALIPVAMGALYPLNGTLLSPMLAGGAMALSSVFVVTNALRLRGAGGPPRRAPAAPPAPALQAA